MKGFAEKKAEKLLRVNVEYTDIIESIEISGDFFVHPEESLTLLENAINGLKVTELDLVVPRIVSVVNSNSIDLVGITPYDIRDVVKEAVK